MSPKTAPYGTWKSPITAESFTKGVNSIQDVIVDRVTSQVYHIESRPSEGGRSVLVHTESGSDVVGPNWNVQTTVHEWGGTPALVHNGAVYFSNLADGRIYRVVDGKEPEPVTPNKPYRYACLEPHPCFSHLLVAVLEDHTIEDPANIENRIVILDINEASIYTLIQGSDCYAFPKLSPDGTKIAWQQWRHPDMPWDGSEVCVANLRLEDGRVSISNQTVVAGLTQRVSASYPEWANQERLIFTSDLSGYINPWRYESNKAAPLLPEPIAEDFGPPLWFLRSSPYAILDMEGSKAIFSASRQGRDVLYLIDLRDLFPPKEIETPLVVIQSIRPLSKEKQEIVIVGQTAIGNKGVFKLSFEYGRAAIETLKAAEYAIGLAPDLVSLPQPMSLPAGETGGSIHTIFYPPHNPQYSGSNIPAEKPPCVVNLHGGPTFISNQGLDWGKQYYTSRGWAWLDVNYGGSSGYGRQYTERLAGNWGVVDVEDCITVSKAIASPPYSLIDPKRTVVRGVSGGGFTTLAALSIGSDLNVFAAAASLYGVSDLEKMTPHKFELHYIHKLLGGTFTQIPDVYTARSPAHHAENIVVPLLLLQGDADEIVPKEQSELIYNTIKKRGGRVEYKLYPGEGHGWRKEETMIDAYKREIGFYEAVLGLGDH